MPQSYCLKCKKKQEMAEVKETAIQGRGGTTKRALTGVCSKCGTRIFKFLGKAEIVEKGRAIRGRSSKTMEIKEIIEKAKIALADLTGFKTPRGIGAKKIGKEWQIRVEITEKSSIPDAMDVLGIYDVRLDSEGNVLHYERRGLKKRGDTEAKIEEAIES